MMAWSIDAAMRVIRKSGGRVSRRLEEALVAAAKHASCARVKSCRRDFFLWFLPS
jgi:hypothetical protein